MGCGASGDGAGASADARRELYVDVARARENVTIAYGKDDVRDFGDLLVRVQRDNGKLLVRDITNARFERDENESNSSASSESKVAAAADLSR